jgi:hypothetical protein
MNTDMRKKIYIGWLAFTMLFVLLFISGIYRFASKNHNVFLICLILISIGMVLFLRTVYKRKL